jgi:hypothetical protein
MVQKAVKVFINDVFVNDTGGGFVTGSVLLSSLSMTSAVGLSLAVLFVVFVNDIGCGFVTGSVICRLCQ